MMASNKSLHFLFALLCALQLISECQCANITVQPVSINTTLNSTVVFCCEAVAQELFFSVNGEAANLVNVMAKGFRETPIYGDGGIKVRHLEAKAYDDNNNTNITCRALSYLPFIVVNVEASGQTSEIAILMIQGLLDDVGNLNWTTINGSSVLLTWTPPYTLDNVAITGYLVNETEQINATNITLSTTDPEHCKLYNVSVSAINDAGIGSSSYISFYYPTVPLVIPAVFVKPTADDTSLSLNVNINVSELCTAEYPDNITVIILNVDNEIQRSYSIPPVVHNQLKMINKVVFMPNNLTAFTVNVSMSNKGGEFLPTPSFKYAKVGPVTDIKSSPEGCYAFNVTWGPPHSSSTILGYHLIIYNNITGEVLKPKKDLLPDTSYKFDDTELFDRSYMVVITGVNELGEGISNRAIFSYQRVPKSVKDTTIHFIKHEDKDAVYKLTIPIKLECPLEAPANATISILCSETGLVYENISLVEWHPYKIVKVITVSVPMHQQCNITFVVSNGAGHSEPFILPLKDTTAVTSTPTDYTPTVTSITTSVILIATLSSFGVIIVVLLVIVILILIYICCIVKKVSSNQTTGNDKKENSKGQEVGIRTEDNETEPEAIQM